MSATVSTRFDSAVSEHRRGALARSPAFRQEMIAFHYLRLALLAQQMDYLVRKYRGKPNRDVDSMIAHVEEQIRKAHVEDFGCEPVWAQPPVAAAGEDAT